MRQTAAITLLFLAFPSFLFAWGQKGHYMVSEAATFEVPSDMPHFFHRHYPELIYLGYDPDRWRGSGRSLNAANPPEHYLDYEFVDHLELPLSRYDFIQLLTDSNTLRRRGIENTSPGFSPWRIAELSELMEVQWRLWRQSDLPARDRAQIEQNIIQYAGVLGHYVADAANPHHTTINYNGWVEPNPEGYAFDCDTHSRFETQFVSRVMELDPVIPRLREATHRKEYFSTALEFIKESNALVETLYRIDRDGGLRGAGTAEAREFAADRMAAGASMLRDLWWSAWLNSAERGR
ncbi:MAG TPA: hypothetical protein VMS12_11200 [Thermoanaerobaculia bacterium]|nr:hypothetical protein [Thermoanaerobaculia bacterium]